MTHFLKFCLVPCCAILHVYFCFCYAQQFIFTLPPKWDFCLLIKLRFMTCLWLWKYFECLLCECELISSYFVVWFYRNFRHLFESIGIYQKFDSFCTIIYKSMLTSKILFFACKFRNNPQRELGLFQFNYLFSSTLNVLWDYGKSVNQKKKGKRHSVDCHDEVNASLNQLTKSTIECNAKIVKN